MAYIFQKNFELADVATKRAVEINPTDGLAVNSRSQWLSRAGNAPEALRRLDEALQRDPFPPSWHWGNRATALLRLEKFEDAIAAVDRKSQTFWWDHYMRAVCYMYLGKTHEAQVEVAELQKQRPGVSIREIMKAEPFKHEIDTLRLTEGLRKAGLRDS